MSPFESRVNMLVDTDRLRSRRDPLGGRGVAQERGDMDATGRRLDVRN
jgi:hypothetical protein